VLAFVEFSMTVGAGEEHGKKRIDDYLLKYGKLLYSSV